MIAEQVIDLGALVLAYTWCPVPLKSKMAVLVYLLIVRARLIKVPSSMQSYEITVSISFNQLLREILQSIFLMDSSALSYIHSMYWIVVSNEVSDISSINKCTPLLLDVQDIFTADHLGTIFIIIFNFFKCSRIIFSRFRKFKIRFE